MLKRVLIFFSIIIVLSLLSIFYPPFANEKNLDSIKYEKQTCFVNRIIDGDTLICDNETIRLLGINTPEKGEKYYQEAKDYLKILKGKEIKTLRDWDDLGKYHRKLRYIFYNGRLINIEIVEQGLGIAFMTENLVYEDKFLSAEKFAKENCLGIWKIKCNK